MNSFKDASSILFDLNGVFNEGHIVACAVSGNVIAGSYFSMGLGCNISEHSRDWLLYLITNMSADVCSPRSWERVDPHVHLCSKPPLCNACHY